MELKTDLKGLSMKEVKEKIAQGANNQPQKPLTKSVGKIFFDNICTLFNGINLVMAGLILTTGSYKNLLFLGVIFANTSIGIYQEIRAKHSIDKLSLLNQAKVTVVREGDFVDIEQEELVTNDLVMIRRGEQICVDGIVIATNGFEVDESQLTGESDAIKKTVGDSILSGSYVTGGNGYVEALKIGQDSYVNQLSIEAKKEKNSTSELMRTLNRLVKGLTFAILPIGLLLFFSGYLGGLAISKAILGTTAAIIGMIPEGLILITSIALAVGIVNLTKKKVLVKTMGSIETLARVDLLCLDKTGTLTNGELTVSEFIVANGVQVDQLKAVIGALVKGLEDDNPTSMALQKAVDKNEEWKLIESVPFSSARKWSGATFDTNKTYVMGAPEYVFSTLSKADQHSVNQASEMGKRVLAIASSSTGFVNHQLPEQLSLLGFVYMEDTIRAEAPATLKYFNQQGVAIRIISGDNPKTVAHIAERVGVEDAKQAIDMSQVDKEADLSEIIAKYRVFGRVSPTQKRELIQAMQKAGHTVGMTGDGVNDILALKTADCGIAMAEGSTAAKSVSDFVLLDSNFDSLVGVVMEGRRVVNNIQRVASLYLTKTVYSAILAVLFIFMNQAYPFQPIQLSPINALTVGIPSFFLALRPNYAQIKGGFFKNVMKPALTAGILVVLYICMILVLGTIWHLDYSITSTLSVLLTGMVCFTSLIYVANPLSKKVIGLISSLIVVFLLIFLFFGNFFSLVSIFNKELLVFAVPLIVTVVPMYHLMVKLVRKLIDLK
ncbi:HAD-IC family P-type ATPase [Carnobacterium divergens]|uniref:HAD-IC family P-type ATPase n=1 Tax=Carnobacterium divergens TaxID=2748 RepID=UPI000D4BE5B7|nr:HAD-IC family P-type ATPase [Carnobacterium divergens]MCO6017196.1 HAD-IC family P-type ATPase [Carnobacterium divergens]SPC41023.1 ATPase, P-type (Transporting), HAD super, subIC family protein [Carnobacterium divergens]